jgi:hypothetical protein
LLTSKNKLTKTDYEISIHKATSNELSFPTQSDLLDLAAKSNIKENCESAIKHVTKKLQTPKEKWRKILKTLNLVEVLIAKGHRRFTLELQSKMFMIHPLMSFIYRENSIDVGQQSGFTSQGTGALDLQVPGG